VLRDVEEFDGWLAEYKMQVDEGEVVDAIDRIQDELFTRVLCERYGFDADR
jgi:hypothetical protein